MENVGENSRERKKSLWPRGARGGGSLARVKPDPLKKKKCAKEAKGDPSPYHTVAMIGRKIYIKTTLKRRCDTRILYTHMYPPAKYGIHTL